MIRCHDTQCGVRARCERYRQRDSGEPGTQHVMTQKHGSVPHELRCGRYQRATGVEPLLESGPAGWLVAAWLLGTMPADVHLGLLGRAER